MKIYKYDHKSFYFLKFMESDIVPMGWTDVAPAPEVLRFKWMKFINGVWVGTETDPNIYTVDESIAYQEALTNYRKRVYEILENEGELIKDYYRSKIDIGTPDPNYANWVDYWQAIITLDNDPNFDPANITWPTPPDY